MPGHSKESGRNRHSTTIGRLDLPPLRTGEVVRMQLPGEKRWTSGICTGLQGPCSYGIRVGEAEYHRNRRHILKGGEMLMTEQAENAVPEQGTTPPGVCMEAVCNNSEPAPQPSITPSTHPQPELTPRSVTHRGSANCPSGSLHTYPPEWTL